MVYQYKGNLFPCILPSIKYPYQGVLRIHSMDTASLSKISLKRCVCGSQKAGFNPRHVGPKRRTKKVGVIVGLCQQGDLELRADI